MPSEPSFPLLPRAPLDPAALDALRRHSGLRIDASGAWHFRGRPVENERVQRLFHAGLRWDAGEQRASLHVGAQWAWVEQVDDVAFFVERVVGEALRLRSGELVPLADVTLEAVGDFVYAALGDGRRARLDRLAVLDLGPRLEADGHGLAVRLADGRTRPIVTIENEPRPGATSGIVRP